MFYYWPSVTVQWRKWLYGIISHSFAKVMVLCQKRNSFAKYFFKKLEFCRNTYHYGMTTIPIARSMTLVGHTVSDTCHFF